MSVKTGGCVGDPFIRTAVIEFDLKCPIKFESVVEDEFSKRDVGKRNKGGIGRI